MRTCNKRLLLLAGLGLVLTFSAKGQTYGSYNGFSWYSDNGQTAEITGYNWFGTSIEVDIPGQINGLTVTAIADNAFGYEFTSGSIPIIVIPDTVTSIGAEAFANCNTVGSIPIPDSVTNIGDYAFYTCFGLGSVTIPGSVISVGNYAFWGCTETNLTIGNGVASIGVEAFGGYDGNSPASWLTSVTIPASVTNIGEAAFDLNVFMKAITVDTNNLFYSSLNGVLFNKNQTMLVEYPGDLGGNYTIPDGVTSIGEAAFADCITLSGITIPCGVTNLGDYAFTYCTSLISIYFTGNAPNADSTVFEGVDAYGNNAMVYYLPGTTGWSNTFAGLPTVLWNPLIQASGANFGVQNNKFGFNITGTANIPIVVETATNLTSPMWTTLTNINLTNGLYYFSDPQWMNYPERYYRIASP